LWDAEQTQAWAALRASRPGQLQWAAERAVSERCREGLPLSEQAAREESAEAVEDLRDAASAERAAGFPAGVQWERLPLRGFYPAGDLLWGYP
jgi:hypothetical protein